MNVRVSRPSQQHGVIVLVVLTILLAFGSFVVLRALNEGVQRARSDRTATTASLVAAERALIGYALRYPDNPAITSLDAGPGHLPCPDTRFDPGDVPGQADPPCGLSAATETGYLPWRTLDLPELRDADEAPLWYAVADAFRNNPAGVINPDTRAQLRIDDCDAAARDIAALLFAPGAALSGQDRSTAHAAVRYEVSNYLEGENASRGDGCFGSRTSSIANDVVRVIERGALMRRVQQRVLADVANALARYYADPDGDDVDGVDPDCAAAGLPGDCDKALPWLAPFDDPTTSGYHGVVGVRRGLLPLRRVGVDFPAAFYARWRIPASGTVSATGPAPPEANCVRDTAAVCTLAPVGFTAAAAYTNEVRGSGTGVYGAGVCRWLGGRAMRCATTLDIADPGASGNAVQRTFTIEIDGLPRRLVPPSATAPRLENVRVTAAEIAADASIRITVSDLLLPARTPLGTTVLTIPGGAPVADFALLDVPCDLEVDDDGIIDPTARRSPGELPRWFTANSWQRFVFVAYADAYAPGAAAATCVANDACLRVRYARFGAPATTVADVRAVVIAAGPALATQTRPSGDLAQWFEGDNAKDDDHYEMRDEAADFNDRLSRVELDE